MEIGEMRQEENKKVNGGACVLRCGSGVTGSFVLVCGIIDAMSDSIAIYSVVVCERYFL